MAAEAQTKIKPVRSPRDLFFLLPLAEEDLTVYLVRRADGSFDHTRARPAKFDFKLTLRIRRIDDSDLEEERHEAEGALNTVRATAEAIFNAMKDITNFDPERRVYRIHFEVYDDSQFLGEADSYVILFRRRSPFSGDWGKAKRAWAVAFDWKDRVSKKYPDLASHFYVKGHTEKVYGDERATVFLLARIPYIAAKAQNLLAKVFEAEEAPEVVVIRGFLVESSLPSTALLDTSLPEIFSGLKIGKKEIRLVTGYFYNRLKVLRTEFYQILNEFAVKIPGLGYIIPASRVRAFYTAMDELRQKYAKYDRDLRRFLTTGQLPEGVRKSAKFDREYTQIVLGYLKKHGVELDLSKLPNFADRFYVRLVPFALDTSYIMSWVDESAREVALEQVKKLAEEIKTSARQKIEEHLNRFIDRLERLSKTKLTPRAIQALREQHARLVQEALDLGLEDVLPRLRLIETGLRDLEEFALQKAEQEVQAGTGGKLDLLYAFMIAAAKGQEAQESSEGGE